MAGSARWRQEGSGPPARSLAAVAALVALFVGAPVILVKLGAWQEVSAVVHDPSLLLLADDGHLVLAVLTVIGAVFWLILAGSIVAESVVAVRNRVSGGREPGPPAQGWFRLPRNLVRPLVSAAFALAVVGGSAHTAVAEPVVPVPVQSVVLAAVGGGEPGAMGEPGAEDPADGQGRIHTVAPGDSLWSIAEDVYGDGGQWVEIAQANRDLVTGTGDLIRPGLRLRIPPPASEPLPPPEEEAGRVVTVQPGDSLWSIAEDRLGDGARWPEISGADPALIADPGSIQPGWTVLLPDEAGSSPAGPDPDVEASSDQSGGPVEDTPESVEDLPDEDLPGSVADLPGENPSSPAALPPLPASSAAATPHPAGGPTASPLPASQPGQEMTDETRPDFVARTIGISAVLAGGMVIMLRRRRVSQLRERPIGRRILQPDEAGNRLEAALGVAGSRDPVPQNPVRFDTMRMETGSQESHGPSKSDGLADDAAGATLGEGVEADFGFPEAGAAVCVGENEQGEAVSIGLGKAKPFLVCAPRAETASLVVRGLAMHLAVGEWLSQVDLHVVTAEHLFATFDGVECHPTYRAGLDHLQAMVEGRRRSLGGGSWEQLRRDPDQGEAWRSVVYCFVDPIAEDGFRELSALLGGPDLGVGVVATIALDDLPASVLADETSTGRLLVESFERGVLYPGALVVRPLMLEPSVPLGELLMTSSSQETTPAWWSSAVAGGVTPARALVQEGRLEVAEPVFPSPAPVPGLSLAGLPSFGREAQLTGGKPFSQVASSGDPAPTVAVEFNHPTLKLLGPILLEGTQGPSPQRAERACMECCGWLLEHPGSTATAMAQGMVVAEGTRRSNMSRLRRWLGHDADGHPYLPEAYSGRIWLDVSVTSDWQRLCLLIKEGVEATDTNSLIQALQLVRGAPLADAGPGQWHWAEELRIDMVSVIRDVGVVATQRCLDKNDIDRARWTASRALVAAPEDELLLCARALTEHAAGNRMEVERLVSWITRNSRNLGVDLLPQTVTILQRVIGTDSRAWRAVAELVPDPLPR